VNNGVEREVENAGKVRVEVDRAFGRNAAKDLVSFEDSFRLAELVKQSRFNFKYVLCCVAFIE